MKKSYKFLISILLLIILVLSVRFFIGGNEDSWIKDGRGVWIKHGNPAETPSYVLEQQQLIDQAKQLFVNYTGNLSNGPCLGAVGNYVVDIVHNPRQSVDNLPENQCEDYKSGNLKNFMELDENGEVVRVVD